jgi:hypothetical protein
MAASKPYNYGGQAVLEGVMIRGQRNWAVAVRHPNGEITSKVEKLKGPSNSGWVRIPFLRGLVVLWDTLLLGARSLLYSANVALDEEDAEITSTMMGGVMGFALLAAVGLFFLAPLLLVQWADDLLASSLISNLIEGIIRLGLVIGYIAGVSLLKDIRRVYAYHGAEHKAINALEDVAPLEVDSVRRYSRAHARCGTAFLLTVVVLSVFVFALLGDPPLVWRVLSRILLVPVIASLAYEFIRFTADHRANPIVAALSAPGLALQSITTREPDDSQIEVAIAALCCALDEDAETAGSESDPEEAL